MPRPLLSLRPLQSRDRPRVRAGLACLRPETLYRRFGMPVAPRDGALRWMDELDGVANVAWGACDRRSGRPVGLARTTVFPEDRRAVELAVTVVDEWQGRGVGTLLAEALLDQLASAGGVVAVRACILADNRPAERLMRRLGGRPVGPAASGSLDLELRLAAAPALSARRA